MLCARQLLVRFVFPDFCTFRFSNQVHFVLPDLDVTSHYGYIYDAIREIWYAELARRVSDCQTEGLVMPGLDVDCFLGTFTSVLYSARMAGCPHGVLEDSALFMLRGAMTARGISEAGVF